MATASPDDRSPAPPPVAPPSAGGPGALARLLAEVDDAALEQALVDLATDPAGPALRGAWLMLWDPAAGRLTGRCRARTRDDALDEGRGWRAHAVTAARLDEVSAAAWAGAGARVGESGPSSLPWAQHGTIAAVTLWRGGRRWGLLVGGGDAGADRAATASALQAYGALAGAALDAHDRSAQARRRAQQAAALAEFAAAAGAAGHLAEALHLAVRLASAATGSGGSVVWRADEQGAPWLEVTHGAAGRREDTARALGPLAVAAMTTLRPVVLDRVLDDARLSAEAAATLADVAVVPWVVQGRALGAIAVVDRAPPHAGAAPGYDAGDLQFLGALAGLLAFLVEQAELGAAHRGAEQRERELRIRLAREERLAALGEAALRTAREARNPVASIAAFARRVHRGLPESDAQRESLEIVMREAGRLERMLAETLAEAPPDAPRLRVQGVNQSVQEVLQAAGETLVRRRVRLLKKLAPDLPALLLDAEQVRRVLGNILAFALDSVSIGGRVRVESRRAGAYVLLEIAHDGSRTPGDLMEQLFVSFAGATAPHAGSGLGVAQRIIHEHGGEIRVRSEGDWTNVVSFTLPVAENRDRRQAGAERRQGRPERRHAAGG